jgi:hypothetical protein
VPAPPSNLTALPPCARLQPGSELQDVP